MMTWGQKESLRRFLSDVVFALASCAIGIGLYIWVHNEIDPRAAAEEEFLRACDPSSGRIAGRLTALDPAVTPLSMQQAWTSTKTRILFDCDRLRRRCARCLGCGDRFRADRAALQAERRYFRGRPRGGIGQRGRRWDPSIRALLCAR